ncbi:probable starch synthase 4, chloroplastic/amyloplastic isoform X2 [Phalaenopsis equestris]|uniref:probable starch synthase 4, chloroplastic/amyloplastic isoform X2 n=1 Tax=Phalaenopsis equestris TaxID=78828 RepID=UPI0009E36EFD|nr:probable starch synthase 4, chloroplastic/amyloplastic isoform X2 [Phalaenopsis equestris]
MATQACALVLWSGFYESRQGRLTACMQPVSARRMIQVYCKMRNRNIGSSPHKKHQNKKVSESLPLNTNFEFQSDESVEVNNTSSNDPMTPFQYKLSDADPIENLPTISEGKTSSTGDKIILLENVDGRQRLPIDQLEDLTGMIKHAEKNVLLLNQARISALKDLDRILSEKAALQAEINDLELKLPEAKERLKVTTQERMHVEFLEDELERLKNKMYSKDKFDGKVLTSDSFSQDAINVTFAEELNALRIEYASLKDDIKALNEKLNHVPGKEECISMLEKGRSLLETPVRELKSELEVSEIDISVLSSFKTEFEALWDKVENLQALLDTTTARAMQAATLFEQNLELQANVDKLEASLEESNAHKLPEKSRHYNELVLQKIEMLEERLQAADQEIHSHTLLYQKALEEFENLIEELKERNTKKLGENVNDMPWEFWSRLLLMVDGWLIEKKISFNDGKLLREMVWKKDHQICDAYLACNGKNEHETIVTFLKLTQPQTSQGLYIVHIAAEMAPVAKVGGLGDVVLGLSKALQRKGHLVEIVLPKYDCMQYDQFGEMKALDVAVESFFDGQLFKNKIWVGIVEGLPVYFIEPHHPLKFFWRGKIYGEHDDFKRFSFFSRAALELIYQAGKKPDIIHCHDWQTAFAPLYWDIYAAKGFNSARICFTCHNFEYQGTAHFSELSSCGLDIQRLNKPDRMQDNSAPDKINPLKGGIVFSNIVTTVSPTYAQEVCAPEGGRGLHETLRVHSKKFVGVLNGIDTDSWNPSTDIILPVQYSSDDLQGKTENKSALRMQLELSSADAFQPMVCCITRLVPQKGVHLIRHAIYQTMELGGQFVLLGSSPVAHIQREFEGIASHFSNHPNVRLLLKYDDALSHMIYAASDMFVIPSLFEPCGLTQMIAMRYGSVPIVRRTGGLNDSVFDVDDDTIPVEYRNGFTFLSPTEQELNNAMERAFNYYRKSPENWQNLVQKIMRMDFSWESSAQQYEELYQKTVIRARAAANV